MVEWRKKQVLKYPEDEDGDGSQNVHPCCDMKKMHFDLRMFPVQLYVMSCKSNKQEPHDRLDNAFDDAHLISYIIFSKSVSFTHLYVMDILPINFIQDIFISG
jgi:hypothetical protein